MLEKFSQIAEQAATSASRRQFLGRLGRGAMVVAAAIGGLLTLEEDAQAATVCGPGSPGQCRNRPVGSLCGTRQRPGYCVGAPNCTCRTCPRGTFWQPCSTGQRICCRRGYYCYVRNGVPTCRRGA
jgi:hypothetical protein